MHSEGGRRVQEIIKQRAQMNSQRGACDGSRTSAVPPDRNGTLMGVRQSRYVAADVVARASVYVNGSAVLSHASSSTLPHTPILDTHLDALWRFTLRCNRLITIRRTAPTVGLISRLPLLFSKFEVPRSTPSGPFYATSRVALHGAIS